MIEYRCTGILQKNRIQAGMYSGRGILLQQ